MEKIKNNTLRNGISRNVIMTGLVSLFNDISSDMTTPLIPIFMSSMLNAPVYIIGITMGLADGLSNILKVGSGWLSDRLQKRKIFVIIGYILSAFSKGMMGFAYTWVGAFASRVSDRMGKGVRTAARDAILVESSTSKMRSSAFGIHRSLDSMGAIIGPLIGIVLVHYFKISIRSLFFIAIVPSLIGIVLLVLFVKETATQKPASTIFQNSNRCNKNHCYSRSFFWFLGLTTFFNLANSSDAFLFLRARSAGASVIILLLLHALQHTFYSLFSFVSGITAKKHGEPIILMIGYFLFACIYLLCAFTSGYATLFIIFPLYGIFFGLTDGMAPSYISRLVKPEVMATSFGLYYTLSGFSVMIASIIAGGLWSALSPRAPFIFGAVVAFIAAITLAIWQYKNRAELLRLEKKHIKIETVISEESVPSEH